jgi:hypothetical protein
VVLICRKSIETREKGGRETSLSTVCTADIALFLELAFLRAQIRHAATILEITELARSKKNGVLNSAAMSNRAPLWALAE